MRWLLLFFPVFAQAQVAFVSADSDIDNGETYTAGAGSNRVVIYTPHAVLAGTLIDLQSGTFDAPLNIRAEAREDTGTAGRSLAILDVLEASIPVGANALTATYDNAPGNDEGTAITLSGVNQSSPVSDSDVVTGFAVDTSCALSVTVSNGDMVIAAAGSTNDISQPAGYTSVRNDTVGVPDTSVVYKAISAGGTENLTFTAASGVFGCAAVVYSSASSSAAAKRRRMM